MKDLMLIIVTFAAFAFGFYIMKKIDDFIADNQRHITAENRNSRSHIHIAAESPMLLDYVASALEYCSAAHPYMEFFFSSGKVNQLLHKLSDGTVDIVLLSDEIAKSLSSEYVSIQIPYHAKQAVVTTLGLNVENTDQDCRIYVIWNKTIQSKNRDRVIFALENEYCTLKHGYCDYID